MAKQEFAQDAALNQDARNTISREYDAASRLKLLSDNFAAYGYTHDSLGRSLATTINYAGLGLPTITLTNGYADIDGEGPQVERFDGLRTSLSASIGGTADLLTEDRYNALHRVQSIRQIGQGGNAVAEKRVRFCVRGRWALQEHHPLRRPRRLGSRGREFVSVRFGPPTYGPDPRPRHAGANSR